MFTLSDCTPGKGTRHGIGADCSLRVRLCAAWCSSVGAATRAQQRGTAGCRARVRTPGHRAKTCFLATSSRTDSYVICISLMFCPSVTASTGVSSAAPRESMVGKRAREQEEGVGTGGSVSRYERYTAQETHLRLHAGKAEEAGQAVEKGSSCRLPSRFHFATTTPGPPTQRRLRISRAAERGGGQGKQGSV